MNQEETRKLDHEVAVKIMGWHRLRGCEFEEKFLEHSTYDDYWHNEHHEARPSPPLYSREIEDAWKVVETLRDRSWEVEIRNFQDGWVVVFAKRENTFSDWNRNAAEAICRAALGWGLRATRAAWNDGLT